MHTTPTVPEHYDRKLLTVDAWPKFYPWPSRDGLRFYIKNRHNNGLARHNAILRMGRRILIDPDRFFQWIDAQNGVAT